MTIRDDALQVLIESYFDRTADEAQLAELDRRLRDQAAAEQFQQFAALDELLRGRMTVEQQEFAARELLADLNASPDGASPEAAARRCSPVPAIWRGAVDYLSTPAHFGVFFAAVSCVSLMLFFAQISWTPRTPPEAAVQDAEVVVESVKDCRWQGQTAIHSGQVWRHERRLRLTAGQAVFRTARGARIEVAGPADFRWRGGEQLELERGRASARVPHAARGFVVATPAGRIVDLGTEFAVEVDSEGRTEVHVARGAVTFALYAASEHAPVRIGAQQGVVSSADGRLLDPITFEPARFAASQPRILTGDDDGRIAYRGAHLGLARYRSPRIVKPWDADGDQKLGTAGYFFFNSTQGKNRYQEPFAADALHALPDFVVRLSPRSDQTPPPSSASYDAYLDLDDPRRPGETINSGAGSIAAPQTGAVLPLFEMHLSAEPSPFRLGVLVDNLRSIDHSAEWNLPAALQLVSDRGDASQVVRLDRSRIGDGDWYFFDVRTPHAGEVLTLKLTASRARSQAIGGMVFDALPPDDQ